MLFITTCNKNLIVVLLQRKRHFNVSKVNLYVIVYNIQYIYYYTSIH